MNRWGDDPEREAQEWRESLTSPTQAPAPVVRASSAGVGWFVTLGAGVLVAGAYGLFDGIVAALLVGAVMFVVRWWAT